AATFGPPSPRRMRSRSGSAWRPAWIGLPTRSWRMSGSLRALRTRSRASAMRSELALAKVCERIVDCAHRTAPESDTPYAYAVGTKAVADGRIDFSRTRPVDADSYANWSARTVPEFGDLILCREAPVGPIAMVPREPLVC